MSETRRKPQAFRLDEAHVEIAPPSDAPVPVRSGAPEALFEPVVPAEPKTNPWIAAFWTGLAGIVSLAFGLAVSRLIEDLFQRAAWLGWVGVAAVGLFALAGLVLLIREWMAIRRLARFDRLRSEAEIALAARDDRKADEVARAIVAMLGSNPRTAGGRAAYEAATRDAVIDGRDRLRLVEREILEPLDRAATTLVAEAARRVSVVTAISPRAGVDLAVVFMTAVSLVRRLAELYGGRPGTLGLWRLMRQVLVHMAVTGGMAAGDSLLDQLIGQGLASKLSAKLGEGVLNGLLTARLGVTAIALIRPLPYIGAPKPDIRDLVGDAFTGKGGL
jgi:putative membrane protein